jgi:hypothetical protein
MFFTENDIPLRLVCSEMCIRDRKEGGKESVNGLGPGKEEATAQEGGEENVPTEAEMAALNESLPAFIHVMWKISQLDIQKTAARAAKKIVRDHGVSETVRRRRAQGLIVLGSKFKQVGKEAMVALKAQVGEKGGKAAVKLDAKHLEEVLMKTMAIGQGQEL